MEKTVTMERSVQLMELGKREKGLTQFLHQLKNLQGPEQLGITSSHR